MDFCSEHSVLHVLLSVFGFLMPLFVFTVIRFCSVSVVRVFPQVHPLEWGVTFRC